MLNIEDDVEKIMNDILQLINSFEEVEKNPKASVSISDFENNKVKINCSFWFKTTDVTAPGGSLRSKILKKVLIYIKTNNINIPPATA